VALQSVLGGTIRSPAKCQLDSFVRSRILLLLAQPLRVRDSSVKLVGGFVEFELTCFGGLRRFCEKSCNLRRIPRLKTAGGPQGLLKNRDRIAARDNHAGGKTNRVLQALDCGSSLAPQNNFVAHGLHGETSNALFGKNR